MREGGVVKAVAMRSPPKIYSVIERKFILVDFHQPSTSSFPLEDRKERIKRQQP